LPQGPISFGLFTDQSYSGAPSTDFGREQSPYFGIHENTGLVYLRRTLDFDDRTQPTQFRLIGLEHLLIIGISSLGVAREDGKESTVPVEIEVLDVNDNGPQFVQPLYSASVREDLQLGETILIGWFKRPNLIVMLNFQYLF
jgi:hypothetical protein